MGQYYRPALLIDNEVRIFNRDIDGEYTGAKLTEHSWWRNQLCNAIAEMMYMKKVRLVWCGDYAEDELRSENSSAKDDEVLTPKQIWDCEGEGLESTNFNIDNLFLVNHDQKCYIDLNKYYEKSKGYDIYEGKKEWWCLFPISLLTAKGNGLGGGDYWGTCDEMIGSWCWDLISLEPEILSGYTEDDYTYFRERNGFLKYDKEIED